MTLEEKWLVEHLGPLDEHSLDREVRDLLRHAYMVNEIGRMILFGALKNGKISIAEFKRRALENNPGGRKQLCP